MEYLIAKTTREERKKLASDALGILLLDATMPSSDCMRMVDRYINGEMEIDEILEQLKRIYPKSGMQPLVQ